MMEYSKELHDEIKNIGWLGNYKVGIWNGAHKNITHLGVNVLDVNRLGSEEITNLFSRQIVEMLNAVPVLVTEIDRLTAENAKLREANRWIPVIESKPKTGKPVFISCIMNGKRFQQKAVYIAPKSTLSEDYLSDEYDCDNVQEYDEENDCFWVKEGWWEESLESDINWNIRGEVTHWRPLPEPPQEAE